MDEDWRVRAETLMSCGASAWDFYRNLFSLKQHSRFEEESRDCEMKEEKETFTSDGTKTFPFSRATNKTHTPPHTNKYLVIMVRGSFVVLTRFDRRKP